MKSNMEWITSLEKNYSVLMEENNQTRFSQLLLKAALIRNEPIDQLVRQYRDYLEAALFGRAFVEAYGGLNTRRHIRELFTGSETENALHRMFQIWDYEVSDDMILELIEKHRKEFQKQGE